MTAVQRLRILRGVLAHFRTLDMQHMLHSSVAAQHTALARPPLLASTTSVPPPWRRPASHAHPTPGWASSFVVRCSSSSSALLERPQLGSFDSVLQQPAVQPAARGVEGGGPATTQVSDAAGAAGEINPQAAGANARATSSAASAAEAAASAPSAAEASADTAAESAPGSNDAPSTTKPTRKTTPNRQRSSSGASTSSSSSSSSRRGPEAVVRRQLLSVKGLGPKYVQLLSEKAGIASLDDLLVCFQKEGSDEEKMKEFLQQTVGIRNSAHANSITTELKARSAPPKLTFCVEGNISAGKSTFLDYIGQAAAGGVADGSSSSAASSSDVRLGQLLGNPLTLVPEPVDQWQHVNGSDTNILEQFYADPKRFAYTFQNYVFLTRMMQEHISGKTSQPVRIMERSIFSDRMVFVRAVMEKKWMNDVELAIYDSWFNPMLTVSPSLMPDGFIYLKTDPDVCMQRLHKRGRKEETGIDMAYLDGLHSKHEDWLGAGTLARDFPGFATSGSSASGSSGRDGSGSSSMDGSSGSNSSSSGSSGLLLPVPEVLQDCLYFLDKNANGCSSEMLQALDRVPALVLDTNADVFADRDLAAQHQAKVAAYVKFMQQLRQQRGGTPLTGRARAHPGAPKHMQHVEHLQTLVREHGARAVPMSNGQLVSGGLEALSALVDAEGAVAAGGGGGAKEGAAKGGARSMVV